MSDIIKTHAHKVNGLNYVHVEAKSLVPELVEQGIPSGHAEAKPLVLEPVEMGIFADTQLGGF